jgi:hypothetical protein
MTTKRISPKKPAGHKKTELEELDDLDLGSSLSSMRSKGKKSSNKSFSSDSDTENVIKVPPKNI